MSHSYLDFADFDGAWRYSSTPSIGTAQTRLIAFAGTPTLIQLREPITHRSLSLEAPVCGSIAARRRTQSDTPIAPFHCLSDGPSTTSGAQQLPRPMSVILVSFSPINWLSADSAEPHPGTPADIVLGDDVEAVSPKSRLPGALQRALRPGTEMSVRIEEPDVVETKRLGSSTMAVKSPYPPELRPGASVGVKLKAWVKRMVRKLRR